MRQQLIAMLKLQEAMNSKVHPQWRKQDFAWYRAIWVECAELLDHHGWKWWKRQNPDIDQIVLELVDIWHFGLSALLVETDSLEAIAERIESDLSSPKDNADFTLDLEAFTLYTLNHKQFDCIRFKRLMDGVEMDFASLYTGYVGKNVLNFFRQDHGYKDGIYHKLWGNKEDNEHLVDIVATLDVTAASFSEDLYERMQVVYTEHCK